MIGEADKSRFNDSIFGQYYIDCGFIISASQMDFDDEEGLEII
jgi:hypothetical protein